MRIETEIAEALQTLTRRETDVLRGICEGKSNKEIARDLDLQEVTVKLHVKTLSRKLGVAQSTATRHCQILVERGRAYAVEISVQGFRYVPKVV